MNRNIVEWVLALISIIIIGIGIFLPKGNLILSFILIVIMFVLRFIYPKLMNLSTNNPKIRTLRRINILSILLISFLTYIKYKNHAKFLDISIQFWIVVGIMVITGNIAPKIPMNRYFGYRLPWTIRDDKAWRVAHRVLGYSSFIMSIIMIILFYKGIEEDKLIKYSFGIWIVLPAIWSLIIYMKGRKKEYD